MQLQKEKQMFLPLFLMLTFSLFFSFSAVSYDPGCETGQYVKLRVYVEGMEKAPGSPIETIRYEVRSVTGDSITYHVVERYQDEDEREFTDTVVIEEVSTPSVEAINYIIAGDLEEGDAISPSTSEAITGEEWKNFEDLGRSMEVSYYEGAREGDFDNYRLYWDKSSGMLVAYYHLEIPFGAEETVYTTKAEVIDTNLETSESWRAYPWFLIGGGVTAAVIVIGAVVLLLRR